MRPDDIGAPPRIGEALAPPALQSTDVGLDTASSCADDSDDEVGQCHVKDDSDDDVLASSCKSVGVGNRADDSDDEVMTKLANAEGSQSSDARKECAGGRVAQSSKMRGERRFLGGSSSVDKVNRDIDRVRDNGVSKASTRERTLGKTSLTLRASESVFSHASFSKLVMRLARECAEGLKLSGCGMRALKSGVENFVRDVATKAKNVLKPRARLTVEHLREAECVLLGIRDGSRIAALATFEERSVAKLHKALADDMSSNACRRLLYHPAGITTPVIHETKLQLIDATERLLREVAFKARCRGRIRIDAVTVEEACSSLHIRCEGDSQIPRARGRSGFFRKKE